ncbi:MAG: hypothetical protein ACYDBB_16100 [Armatimonadota bacterium]
MKLIVITGVILLAIASLLPGCKPPEKLAASKDMVRFDQVFIPALALTSQQQPEAAKNAMRQLTAEWKGFQQRYADQCASDAEWQRTFIQVDQRIGTANTVINTKNDFLLAHEELEGVRSILLNLRMRNNIEYFPDYLTEFHGSMEAILLTVNEKTPETLTPAEMAKLLQNLQQATALWRVVEKKPFDPLLYDFSPEKTALLRTRIANEARELDELTSAVKARDAARVLKETGDIKPEFQAIYLLFGNVNEKVSTEEPAKE